VSLAWGCSTGRKGGKAHDYFTGRAETQTWLQFAIECGYLAPEIGAELRQTYDYIIGKLVNMIINPTPWILRRDR